LFAATVTSDGKNVPDVEALCPKCGLVADIQVDYIP
jgi:hypothetical protein